MKHFSLTLRAAIVLTITGLAFQSCQTSLERIEDWEQRTPSNVPNDIRQAVAPEGFSFESTHELEFELIAKAPGSDAGMANVGMSLWVEGSGDTLVQLAQGASDVEGRWSPDLSIANDRDSVTLRVHTPGYPREHRIAVTAVGMNRYVLGQKNGNGRIVPEPRKASEPAVDSNGLRIQGQLASRAAFEYLGSYDEQGVPQNLTSPAQLWPDILDFIAVNLPEENINNHHPDYINTKYESSVKFVQAGELWISFAHEGAGYTNSIGYFMYPLNAPPTRLSQISVRTIAFPNVSYEGSGGGLKVADRVYIGQVPANTGVCWFLIPNGWDPNKGTVVDAPNTRYTIDKLNTFAKSKDQKHSVLLANKVREFLVLGFEDLNRPGGDLDFNDAVLVVEAKPWSSLDLSKTPNVDMPGVDKDRDGVADYLDLYPDDSQRAFETYAPAKGVFGTVAYEDMWPRIGDYDFNDLVVDYSITEVLTATNKVKELKMDLVVRALGGSQNHGFAIQLPVPPEAVQSVVGSALKGNGYMEISPNGTESGSTNAVIPAFTDGFQLFNATRGIINTDPEKPRNEDGRLRLIITFNQPLYRENLGRPPYDAFMIRSQDRGREIHLAGYAPTTKADRQEFNTEMDASNPDKGAWYVDKNNMPWAIHLPTSFQYPQERRRIDEVYKNFNEWAVYGGASMSNWFRPNPANIDGTKAF